MSGIFDALVICAFMAVFMIGYTMRHLVMMLKMKLPVRQHLGVCLIVCGMIILSIIGLEATIAYLHENFQPKTSEPKPEFSSPPPRTLGV